MHRFSGHLLHDFHSFDANGTDALNQIDRPFFVVGKAISIKQFANGGVFGGLFFVLI